MHLVACVCDEATAQAVRSFRDATDRFYLHPVSPGGMPDLLAGLKRLDFAGAMVLEEGSQVEAQRLADRGSLDSQELGAADTLTVTQAGVMADHCLGRAIAALLVSHRWDGAGARVVVLGSGIAARSAAREALSLGASALTVLAADRVAAERVLPHGAAGTAMIARAVADPLGRTMLEQADLVVRTDAATGIAPELLGPHLTLVDLVPEVVSPLRRQAMSAGALTFNRRDVEAHRLEVGLTQVLGGPVGIEPLMTLFHAL